MEQYKEQKFPVLIEHYSANHIWGLYVILDITKPVISSMGICSKSQQYIACVKIIDFSFVK